MTAVSKPKLLKEEQYLVDKYGDNITGLLAYGSMVFGIPRKGSFRDYWVIYRDFEAFHRPNEEFYREHLNKPSTVEEQIERSRNGTNFYRIFDEENGIRIKIAAIQEDVFCDLCRAENMVVKGRMQKPVKPIIINETIESAIRAARQDGACEGVNLVEDVFTFEEFLFAVASLSYRSEIRLESIGNKVRSIIDKGREELDKIYRPILEKFDYIEKDGDNLYRDTRFPKERRKAKRATLRRLRRLKWGMASWKHLWRNYQTYKNPAAYCWEKVKGEFRKIFKAWFVYPFSKEKSARDMFKAYRDEIAEGLGIETEEAELADIAETENGGLKAKVNSDFSILFLPLKKAGELGKDARIAADSHYGLVITREK